MFSDDSQSGFGSNIDELLYEIVGNETLDKVVQETAKRCENEGKYSSMLKLELKSKIQLKKFNRGESFTVEWKQKEETQVRKNFFFVVLQLFLLLKLSDLIFIF